MIVESEKLLVLDCYSEPVENTSFHVQESVFVILKEQKQIVTATEN